MVINNTLEQSDVEIATCCFSRHRRAIIRVKRYFTIAYQRGADRTYEFKFLSEPISHEGGGQLKSQSVERIERVHTSKNNSLEYLAHNFLSLSS